MARFEQEEISDMVGKSRNGGGRSIACVRQANGTASPWQWLVHDVQFSTSRSRRCGLVGEWMGLRIT